MAAKNYSTILWISPQKLALFKDTLTEKMRALKTLMLPKNQLHKLAHSQIHYLLIGSVSTIKNCIVFQMRMSKVYLDPIATVELQKAFQLTKGQIITQNVPPARRRWANQ